MGTFGWSMIVSRRVCVTAVAVLICAVGGWGDMFGQVEWQDDFEDGNYTSNPVWDTFSSPGSSAAVSTWEGDYALGPSAMYIGDPLYSGWSGAYVDQVEGNQGILGWLDISQAQSDDTAGVYMVRYTESTVGGMGTGYAMSVNYSDSEQLWTQFWQFDDTSMAEITDAVQISDSYGDVWVRFQAMGDGTGTRLFGRAWVDGESEPTSWLLDSDIPGSSSGITNFYDTGRGGVAVANLDSEMPSALMYFDDVSFHTPEPGTLGLLAAGVGALILRRRRSR